MAPACTAPISATVEWPPVQNDGARDTLIGYLLMKVEEGDWHAVSDAANDLRVLEAKAS